jgi:hypothetical protein
MTTRDIGMSHSDIDGERSDLLPDREAMSLFSTNPSPLLSGVGDMGAQDYISSSTAASDDVSTTAGDIAQDTVGEVDTSEAPDTSDQDRSLTVHQTDSAFAES